MVSETRVQMKFPAASGPAASGSKVNQPRASSVSGPHRCLKAGPFSPLFRHLALALPFLQELRAHALLWLRLAETSCKVSGGARLMRGQGGLRTLQAQAQPYPSGLGGQVSTSFVGTTYLQAGKTSKGASLSPTCEGAWT